LGGENVTAFLAKNSGELGRIISAEFQEYLDLNHGASYFNVGMGKAGFSGTYYVIRLLTIGIRWIGTLMLNLYK
jgi:hypothetical protein